MHLSKPGGRGDVTGSAMYNWNGVASYEQWKWLTAQPQLLQTGILRDQTFGPKATKKLFKDEFPERFGTHCLQNIKGRRPVPSPCYIGTLDERPKVYQDPMPQWDAVNASFGKWTGPFNTVDITGKSYFDGKKCKITAGFVLGTCNNKALGGNNCDCKDGLIKYKVFADHTSDPSHSCEAWFIVMNAAVQNWFSVFRTQETLRTALRCGLTEKKRKANVVAFETYMNRKYVKKKTKDVKKYIGYLKKSAIAGW